MRYFYHPLGENANNITPSTYSLHQYGAALDFCYGEEGLPIYSMTNGTVFFAGTYGGGGNTVIIQTTDTGFNEFVDKSKVISIKYLHLQDYTVEEGQQVSCGTLIGHMGKSGKNANNVIHLHLDISTDSEYDNVRDFNKIIDVTGNASYPGSLKKVMSKYDDFTSGQAAQWAASAGIGDMRSYIFCIFNQTPQLIQMSSSIESSDGSITEEEVMVNNNGYTFTELMEIIAGLCIRELGVSLDGSKETLSAWGVYAKLIRHAFLKEKSSTTGLYNVISRSGRFSGFSAQTVNIDRYISSVNAANLDRETVLNTIQANFLNNDTYNILSEHLSKVGINKNGNYYGVYYNYGYAAYYSNTKNNEDDVLRGINNDTLPHHPASYGPLLGVIGNTAFWGTKM